ncbi:MAG: YebC/PmpR family DNA-binding transcriptional regulator [Bacteroidia bacterium]|nr:MAG: YebC/PmpR family DNA-binding transcriptional regulator [Bacteroidia bacterium]
MGRAFEYRKAAKMKRWGKMSTLFPKLAKAITIAAKEGGSDPSMNAKLRTAILNAKAGNMPKENIERAIKRAEGKDAAEYTEIVYEGKGPHGVLVMVECATDNTTRTVANVKYYFSKFGNGMVPSGSLDFLFERKAVFEIQNKENLDLEELELELIDFGLEEIEEDKDEQIVNIYADYTNFGILSKALEEKGIEVKKATLERFPTSPVEFTDEQKEEIDKMLDKMDEDDDIQAVFTNIA